MIHPYARQWLVAGLAAVLMVISLGATAGQPDDPVVARIVDSDVKASDIKRLLDGMDPAARKQATASTKALASLVRLELGRRAILDEATRKKWDQRPDIAQQIQRARMDVIVSTYLGTVAAPEAAPTDDQIRQAYEANQSRFVLPRRYHLAQIFILLPEAKAQADAARAHAEDLAKALRAGGDFAQLAKANSDDKATAPHGGDLGWIRDDALTPELAPTVRGLAEKETSAAIATKDGWHILRVLETKPAGPAPLDDVRPTIVTALRQQQTAAAASAYVDRLLSSQKAAVNEIELTKLIEPTTD